jgi:hypothetical protein
LTPKRTDHEPRAPHHGHRSTAHDRRSRNVPRARHKSGYHRGSLNRRSIRLALRRLHRKGLARRPARAGPARSDMSSARGTMVATVSAHPWRIRGTHRPTVVSLLSGAGTDRFLFRTRSPAASLVRWTDFA